jgi:hypothetical protein
VDVTVFVHAGGDPGVGYTLQSCPTGLNDGTVQSAASITFSGVELTSPSAAGRYVWRTFVTPRGRATYELQAVAPRPASVTLRGRYDVKRKTAILTGRLVERGRPAARRPVFISGRAGNGGFGRQTLTNANGTFSLRARIGRTTEFSAVVAPDEGACEGTTSAPGGCLGSISVPPDGARTTGLGTRTGRAAARDPRRRSTPGRARELRRVGLPARLRARVPR